MPKKQALGMVERTSENTSESAMQYIAFAAAMSEHSGNSGGHVARHRLA